MDAFISTLPSGGGMPLYLYDNTKNNEGNVCTKAQVSAIKAKGWKPVYYNGADWLEYAGSNDGSTGINAIKANVENSPIYNINGQRVMPTKCGVYIINGKKVVLKE